MQIERPPIEHNLLSAKGHSPHWRTWIAAALLMAPLLPARAFAAGSVVLPDSVRQLDEAPAGGKLNPHKPLITRKTLKAEELAETLDFEVALKMRNFSELQDRVNEGEVIPVQEIAAKYEPAEADFDATVAWLEKQGLTVFKKDPNRIGVFVRGKYSDVARVLGVKFARVAFEGKEYTSAITEPSVPVEISPKLVGISGLQPHVRPESHTVLMPLSGSGGSVPYFPQQIAQAYDVEPLYNGGVDGSGQSIAVVTHLFPLPSDLESFWQGVGIHQSISNIQYVQTVPGPATNFSGDAGEATLDVEWASSLAPGARVRDYGTGNQGIVGLDQGYAQIFSDVTSNPSLRIHQMSVSFGIGETYTTNAAVHIDDQYFAELTAAGVTIFCSSGDAGSTPGTASSTDETGPLQVIAPASDPDVNAVGGTTLILDGNNNISNEYVWNSNGGASGGGVSIYWPRPSWQPKIAFPGTTGTTNFFRAVPDIAGSADPSYGAAVIFHSVEEQIGGTSWSAPSWAAYCALINEARSNIGEAPIGLLGPKIYPLITGSNPQGLNINTTYPLYFHDIKVGNNLTGASGTSQYFALTGEDLCTGLGTPLVTPLSEFLNNTSRLIGVEMPVSVERLVPGQNAQFTVTVTGTLATYQWQRMPIGSGTWSNLSDGGPYLGSLQPVLTVYDVTTAMSGDQFQCLVTAGTTSITTVPLSVLIVDTPLNITTMSGQAGVQGVQNGVGPGALFRYPCGLAVDGSGDVYVADTQNSMIREIIPDGTVSTPYGDPAGEVTGTTNGQGNNALFNLPNDIAIDGSGNLYVADSGNNMIREISGTSGNVSTLAGGTTAGFLNATGTAAMFNDPLGIAVDGSGNVYVADSGNNIIRKVTQAGVVTTFAGKSGTSGFANGPVATALFDDPTGIAVDGSSRLYVADFGNTVVRLIASGTVSTLAGQPKTNGYLDGRGASALFYAPIGVALDGSNNLYITDCVVPPITDITEVGNDILRKLSPAGVVSTLAGAAGVTGTDDGSGAQAEFNSVQKVGVGGSGSIIYLADTFNDTIRSGTATIFPPGISTMVLSGTLAFGNVPINLTATNAMVISNTGNSTFSVTGISYPTGFSGDFSSGVIPASGSQTVHVTFAPTQTIPYGGEVVVASDATSGSNEIAISGTGVTAAVLPVVTTGSATSIGGSSVVLTGSVNAEGAPVVVSFNYGLTGTYGSTTGTTSGGSSFSTLPFAQGVSGLQALATYHYQAVATNAATTVTGSDATFTTLAFSTTPVVQTGGSAAGVTGGEYSLIGNPAINSSDYLAFEGTLLENVNGVTATNNAGIWAESGSGAWQLIARTSGTAPGTTNATWVALGNPVYNDNEDVAFLGTLRVLAGQATAATKTGIWCATSGTLSLVARTGGQAPGFTFGTTFRKFSALALPDQGGALFLATVSTGVVGIWQNDPVAGLKLIVKVGDSVGGKTLSKLSFLPTLAYVGGQSRSFAQTTGTLVYRAAFSDKSTGIVEVNGTNGSQILVASTQSAPGVAGGQFSAFGNPIVNANGYVAFTGTLATGVGGVASTNKAGVWADDNTGTLQLIARTGGAAPGTSATFLTLGDPVYTGTEAVAFRGTLKVVAGQATSTTASGIWSTGTGSLGLVVRQGEQAPGCPAGATFKLFSALALPDQGGVLFVATLNTNKTAGVTSSNNVGIWEMGSGGTPELIVRTGTVVNGRTIKSLSFLPILATVGGQTRSFAQSTGDLLYLMTFTDKTTAVSTVVFP